MKKSALLALALATLCVPAMAAEGSHGFLRGEVGNSDVSTDIGDDDSLSALLSGGYWFNPGSNEQVFVGMIGATF